MYLFLQVEPSSGRGTEFNLCLAMFDRMIYRNEHLCHLLKDVVGDSFAISITATISALL